MKRIDPLTNRVRLAAVLAGGCAALIGAVALVGWLLGSPRLYTWGVGHGRLSAGAAVGLVLLGAGIALVAPDWRRSWGRRLALAPAVGTLGIGLLALFEEALATDVVFAEPLGALQFLGHGYVPALTAGGLAAGATALGLFALGGRRRLLLGQALAFVALGLAGIGVTGRVYGLEWLLLGTSQVSRVSLPGLLGLLAASLGLLLARPEVGPMHLAVDPTAGGASFRRLLPTTLALVFFLGALRVYGEARQLYPGPFGSALFAVTTAFLIGGLIVWNALRLREAELSLLREQEIRNERQRQFRHAIVEAPIPILMFAADGEVLQVSRVVEEITGRPIDDIPDLDAWGRLVVGGEEGSAAGESLLAALEGFGEIVVRTHDDGRCVWRIRTSSLGLLNDGREAYVTMATDLTEIRRAEEQKDEFLAVLGHELRNPLAALATGLELQEHQAEPARRAALVDMMRRQVRHLGRLLDDLLDVSRISRGKIILRPEVVALDRAVEQAVEEHRDAMQVGDGPRITLVLPPRPVPVSADPTRLHQILGNLLGNAVKYTPPDGRVWVSLEREEDEAVVRVRDSGVGMEEHEIEAAFEPFRQLDGPDGRRRGGLGLGLTLVRQLADLHGGGVTGASRGRGHGSTFTLRLPIATEEVPEPVPAPAEAPEPAQAPRPAGPLPGAMRVLVVDDHRAVADGFAELLALSGYEVAAAYDGESALDLEERRRPHVVFLDLDLPDVDGRTLARRIRDRREAPPLLVAVSGFGGERHFERSRAAGIDRHMVKPVDMDQVLDLLRSTPGAAELATEGERGT